MKLSRAIKGVFMTVNNSNSINLNTSSQGLGQTTQNLTSAQKFSSVLSQGTSMLARAGAAAAPFVPGGAIMSAALSGVANTASQAAATSMQGGVGAFGGAAGSMMGGGGMPGMPSLGGGMPGMGGGMPGMSGGGISTNPQDMMSKMAAQNMYFLQLQQQTQQTNQVFTTLSNLMNVKHQTESAIINNMRA